MSDIFEGRGTDADNSAKRVPVALCLDTSRSMRASIGELNDAVQLFYRECQEDSKAKNAVEVIAIEFGYNGVAVASGFSEVEYAQTPHFSAGGQTLMGEAVTMALDALEERKEWYKNEGIPYYQPIMVLMSDGGAGDSVVQASRRASDMVKNKRLIVVPLAFGNAKEQTLERFSDGQKVIHIDQRFNFMEFFKWLSASASAMATGKSIDFSSFAAN